MPPANTAASHTVIETGQAFTFEHSLILNKFDQKSIDEPIQAWMRGGFLKPGDLAKKSKITGRDLVYLPFWVVSVEAKSTYKGIFERISPAIVKEGTISKEYDWLVLAREASGFPTREYIVPLEGKIPFDFRKIEGFAKLLNSEMDRDAALEIAKQQIEDHHRFLLQQDVDKIVEIKTEVTAETDSLFARAHLVHQIRIQRQRLPADNRRNRWNSLKR